MLNPQIIPVKLSDRLATKWKQYILERADVDDQQALQALLELTGKDWRAPLSRFLNGHGDEVCKWLKPNEKGAALLDIIGCDNSELVSAFMQLLPSAPSRVNELTGFPLLKVDEDAQKHNLSREHLLKDLHQQIHGETNDKLMPLSRSHFEGWFEALHKQDTITSAQKRYLNGVVDDHLISVCRHEDTDFLLLMVNWLLDHQPDHIQRTDLLHLKHRRTHQQLTDGVDDEGLIELLPQMSKLFVMWLEDTEGHLHAFEPKKVKHLLEDFAQPIDHEQIEELHDLIHDTAPSKLSEVLKRRFPRPTTSAKVLLRALCKCGWLDARVPNHSGGYPRHLPSTPDEATHVFLTPALERYAMHLLGQDFQDEWFTLARPPVEAFEVALASANKAQIRQWIERITCALHDQLRSDAFERLLDLPVVRRDVHRLYWRPYTRQPVLSSAPHHSPSWELVDMLSMILFERHALIDDDVLQTLWATLVWLEARDIHHRYTYTPHELSDTLKARLPALDTSPLQALSDLVDDRIARVMHVSFDLQTFTPTRRHNFGRPHNAGHMWGYMRSLWPYQFAPQLALNEEADAFYNAPDTLLEHHANHGSQFAQLLLLIRDKRVADVRLSRMQLTPIIDEQPANKHNVNISLPRALQWIHKITQNKKSPWHRLMALDFSQDSEPGEIHYIGPTEGLLNHLKSKLSRWVKRALEEASRRPAVAWVDTLRDLLETPGVYLPEVNDAMRLINELEQLDEQTPFWYKINLNQHDPYVLVFLAKLHNKQVTITRMHDFLKEHHRVWVTHYYPFARKLHKYEIDRRHIDAMFAFNEKLAQALNTHGEPGLLIDIWDKPQRHDPPYIRTIYRRLALINALSDAMRANDPPPPIPDELWQALPKQHRDLYYVHHNILEHNRMSPKAWSGLGQYVLPEYRWWFVIDELANPSSLDRTTHTKLLALLDEHFEIDEAQLPDTIREPHELFEKRRDMAIEQNDDIFIQWLQQHNAHVSQDVERPPYTVSSFLNDHPQLASRHFEALNAQTQREVLMALEECDEVWFAQARRCLDYVHLEEFAKTHKRLGHISGEMILHMQALKTPRQRVNFWINRQEFIKLDTITPDIFSFVHNLTNNDEDILLAWQIQHIEGFWPNHEEAHKQLIGRLLARNHDALVHQVSAIGKHLLPVLKCLEDETNIKEIHEQMKVLFDWLPTTRDELKNSLSSLWKIKVHPPLSTWFVRLLKTPTEHHRAYRLSLLSIEDPMTREVLLSALRITLK